MVLLDIAVQTARVVGEEKRCLIAVAHHERR